MVPTRLETGGLVDTQGADFLVSSGTTHNFLQCPVGGEAHGRRLVAAELFTESDSSHAKMV